MQSTPSHHIQRLFIRATLSPYHHSNKGDRNTKGGRGGRAPARDGKRTFDRHSGTGRGKEIKKEGGGGHNWGSDKNDAKKAEGPVTEGEEEAEEGKVAVAEEEEEEEAPEPEPEDKTISYEEYMATKARPDSAAFAPVAERAVDDEFGGKGSFKKEETDFLVMGGGKQLKKKGQKKNEKETLVLDFKVKSAISGDDRGPRRDGRRDGRDGGKQCKSCVWLPYPFAVLSITLL
jgi:plasminogen activator inhibitor 1 RNA-binding protein